MDTLTADPEGSGRTRHRADRPRPDERRGRSPWSPAVLALGVLAFHPLTVTLWSLPDTGHTQALPTHPDEYRTRVLSVFDGALLAR